MELFNTLTRELDPFIPLDHPITIYVCGITPYDTTHLGHAFTYTVADVLIRYLEFTGQQVRYVQNVTDIDDDILRKANQVGEDWLAVGNRWTAHFIQDMIALNVRPPDAYPRATDVVSEIIENVQKLIEANVAYAAGGSVYYDTSSWPEFGKLSLLPKDQMLPIANERGNSPNDPQKRLPLDFVLWQAQAPGEPAWESPWGMGRPGWHIECSTMATALLDETIDIHMGGEDLIFPHHEAEIAQAEPVTGKEPYVAHWLHVAMVRYQGEKMSKSLGNLIWVKDLLEKYSADALRLYLASHHYRTAWSYEETDLEQAQRLAEKLATACCTPSGTGEPFHPHPYQLQFQQAMDQDLDTPRAVNTLDQLASKILSASHAGQDVGESQRSLRELGQVFGLRYDREAPEERVLAGWERHLERFQVKE